MQGVLLGIKVYIVSRPLMTVNREDDMEIMIMNNTQKFSVRHLLTATAVGLFLMLPAHQAHAQGAAVSGFYDTHTGMNEQATGTNFHRELYAGYKQLSLDMGHYWGDNVDAELFNHKARSAGREAPIYPDEVRDRKIPGQEQTFKNALERLKTVFDHGGRHLAPKDTAIAQVSYDCWIEAVEGGKTDRAQKCQKDFEDAIARAEALSNLRLVDITRSVPMPAPQAAPPPPPMPAPVEYKPVPQAVLDQYMRVHFHFDKTEMTEGGRQDFQRAVAALREYPQLRINVIAHADRAGSVEYNKALSKRRADAVLTAFAQAGIDLGRVDVVEAVGESRPMVPTADGVPHPENRVAELKLKIGR